MTPQEVCSKAADYIEQHGWTRGTYEQRGRVCLLGALDAVSPPYEHLGPAFESDNLKARNQLRQYLKVNKLHKWNDAQKSRTPVLKALRAVAAGDTQ